MIISPPLAVITIVAAGLAATAWLAPPNRSAQITVAIPLSIYEQLALRTKGRTGPDGKPLTVAKIIEEFAGDFPL